jgi:hypothetical protein
VLVLALALSACSKDPQGQGRGLEEDPATGGGDAGRDTDDEDDDLGGPHDTSGLSGLAGRGTRDAGVQADAGPIEEGCTRSEVCGDGLDNDCDDSSDEDCVCMGNATQPCYDGPVDNAGVGACVRGEQRCDSDEFGAWSKCEGAVLPETEACADDVDNDCDGRTDEDCLCEEGMTRDCYTGPAGTEGVGECRAGTQTCGAGADGVGTAWGPCIGQVLPDANLCDGVDRSCSGDATEGCPCEIDDTRACYTGPAATRGVGACHDGTRTCESNDGQVNWSAGCAAEATPSDELCGNDVDEDCDSAIDEVCGEIVCPDDLSVLAGHAVQITTTGSGLSNYRWVIVAAPEGGGETAIWGSTPPSTAIEQLTPYIVGTYTVEVTADDLGGNPHSCSVNVMALPHGLRVQLTWDGAGDVDLHLHDDTTTAWFTTPDDCFYSNRALTPWGATLDFDNTSADGPENIAMDAPVIGRTYTIGVHNYARAEGRTSTVRVFCGDSTTAVPDQTFVSRPLVGAASGNCSVNDFWRVARVTFTSATACTIQPIDTYAQSTDACNQL